MGQAEVSERGVLTAPDELWEVAVRQAAVFSRLAAVDAASLATVDEAADELGLSRRQVYVLLGRWSNGKGMVSDLLPGRSSGGRGGSRLFSPVAVGVVFGESAVGVGDDVVDAVPLGTVGPWLTWRCLSPPAAKGSVLCRQRVFQMLFSQ